MQQQHNALTDIDDEGLGCPLHTSTVGTEGWYNAMRISIMNNYMYSQWSLTTITHLYIAFMCFFTVL